MSRYLRPRAPGACIFFTVALAERESDLLVREIGRLREAVAATRSERPFGIDAFVVMPDHLHCVWTLPEGDADYSVRWRLIKGRFAAGLPGTAAFAAGNRCGQRLPARPAQSPAAGRIVPVNHTRRRVDSEKPDSRHLCALLRSFPCPKLNYR